MFMINNLIKQNYFELLGVCPAENDYFKSFIINVEQSNKNNFRNITTVVYRLDTFEVYSYIHIYDIYHENKEESFIKIRQYLMQLEKPIDWKKPHRYCIAQHVFRILRNEKFRMCLEKNKLSNENIYQYTLKSQLKEAAIIKKLNKLSDEEKIQLFTLKNWEIKLKDYEQNNYTTKEILFKVYKRTYLFKRLLDKEKFEHFYDEYTKKIDQIYGLNVNNK